MMGLRRDDSGVESMFDFFGADTLLAVRFFLAFIVVLAVIGVAAWAVRRLGAHEQVMRCGATAAPGGQ